MTPIAVIAGLVIVGDAVDVPAGHPRGFQRLGEAEVQYLHRAVGPQLDVRGLEIAVDDALLVGRFERLRDLPRDRRRFVDRNRSVFEPIGERRSVDELEHEGLHVVRLFEAVNRGDVRMVERREQLRFTLEAGEAIGIENEGVRQDFQRHVTVERRVACAIDLAHSASANGRNDFIRAEAGAVREGHRVVVDYRARSRP